MGEYEKANGINHKTGDEEEWVKVERRHQKVNKDSRTNMENNGDFVNKFRNRLNDFDKVMRDKATSYFFTNFPNSWDSKALWKMFNRYGKVVDVYVAFKRTKLGSKFGSAKIVINSSKFMKVAGKSVPVNSNINLPRQQTRFHMEDFPPFTGNTNSKPHFGSYKDVVGGSKPFNQNPTHKSITIEEDLDTRSKLDRCWVGKAKNFEVDQNAGDIIKNNGLDDCNIKYMGGLLFLFEWPSREAALKSLDAKLIWIQQWFDDVKTWKEDGESYFRLAWVNFERDNTSREESEYAFEDRKQTFQLLPSHLTDCQGKDEEDNHHLNDFPLKEEFVDQTIEMNDDECFSGDHRKSEQEVEGSMAIHSPMVEPRNMGLEDLENDNVIM
ncbi:nucleotide-binding alpha-beta plait domain-containing protein, partial [Tanacetum coccineum]